MYRSGTKAQRPRRAVDKLDAILLSEPQAISVIDVQRMFFDKLSAAQRWEPTPEIVVAVKKAIFCEKPIQKPPTSPLKLV